MDKLTLKEVKQKTLEYLKLTDEADVEYITQELMEQDLTMIGDDSESIDNDILNVREGHNVRLLYVGEEYRWYYERGTTPTGSGCGNDVTKYLSSSQWSGTSIGRCTGSDHKVRFTPI